MATEFGYLVDAAKQLETAARLLRKAANEHKTGPNRAVMVREAHHNINAALARMASIDTDTEVK